MKNPVYIDSQNFPVAQRYFVDSLTLPGDFPLHRHSFVELEYIFGGKGSNIINGVEYPLSPGMASLLLPWHAHELKSDKENPLQIYKCSFRTDFLTGGNELMGHVGKMLLEFKDYQLVTMLDDAGRESFENVFRLALKEKRQNANYKDAFMSALISELVILFLRCSHPTERKGFSVWDVARRIQLEYANPVLDGEELLYSMTYTKLLYYLHKHFAENVSLDQVAKEFHYNKSYLCQLLVKDNTTFHDMLNEIRIYNACKLLDITEKTIEVISAEVGFGSVNAFYENFRKYRGCPPGEYRARKDT